MSTLSRREFLFTSSAAAAGTFAAAGLTHADEAEEIEETAQSGLVTGQPKPLGYKAIPGFLSAEQITPHYTAHYGGALRGYTAADAELQTRISAGRAISSSVYGAITRSRTSKGNSVLLHELYFDGLAEKPNVPSPEIIAAIEKRFGSIDRWVEDFKASASAAAGWAILAFHPLNGNLYNLVSDEHAMGVLWMSTPLLVIDVYEHAYYVDYQNRKAEYISKFTQHIDWRAVNQRYRKVRSSV